MFKTLSGLATCVAALTVTITAAEGKLTVIVLPKPKTAGEGLQTPLVLTGTPEELDAEFGELVAKYSSQYRSLADQCESTVAVLEAAKKASAAKAVDGLKTAAPAVKGVTKAGAGPVEQADEDEDNDGQVPVVAGAVATGGTAATVDNLFS